MKIEKSPKYLRNVLEGYKFNHNYNTRNKINFNLDHKNRKKNKL